MLEKFLEIFGRIFTRMRSLLLNFLRNFWKFKKFLENNCWRNIWRNCGWVLEMDFHMEMAGRITVKTGVGTPGTMLEVSHKKYVTLFFNCNKTLRNFCRIFRKISYNSLWNYWSDQCRSAPWCFGAYCGNICKVEKSIKEFMGESIKVC